MRLDGRRPIRMLSLDTSPRSMLRSPKRERGRNSGTCWLCSVSEGFRTPGGTPFETTLTAISAIQRVAESLTDFFAQRHLHLWIYGHIVEASEPFEILQNMIRISAGERFSPHCFPNRTDGRPQSPGEKVRQIRSSAQAAGIPAVVEPLEEVWDRDLRNAIFHADYCLFRREVRIRNPVRRYTDDEVMTILNRALAYHQALSHLYRAHVKSYTAPKLVEVPPEFGADPEARAQVIVREEDGLAAVRAAWSTEPPTGVSRIEWSFGRYLPGEEELLRRDPSRLVLPKPPPGEAL